MSGFVCDTCNYSTIVKAHFEKHMENHAPAANTIEELLTALESIVVNAAAGGTQEDGNFVGFYVLNTGAIHRAIPILQKHGRLAQPMRDLTTKKRYQALITSQKQALIQDIMGGLPENFDVSDIENASWNDMRRQAEKEGYNEALDLIRTQLEAIKEKI